MFLACVHVYLECVRVQFGSVHVQFTNRRVPRESMDVATDYHQGHVVGEGPRGGEVLDCPQN